MGGVLFSAAGPVVMDGGAPATGAPRLSRPRLGDPPVRCAARSGKVRPRLERTLTTILMTARARFEAARTIPNAGDPRLARRHGHGFVVDVSARLAPVAKSHPIEPVGFLSAALQQAVAPLDYADLDQVLDDPSDVGIARYLSTALAGIDVERIVVSPTPTLRLECEPASRLWVVRRYAFEAAHFLPHVPPGHKCGRMHGHSFEVLLRARGASAGALDQAWAPLGDCLSHYCLNDLDGLSNPTSECLAHWLWERLRTQVPTLASVTVYETGRCGATYDGERHAIWRALTFDAAVQLPGLPAGDVRRRTHGHTYRLRLHLSAPLDAVLGWAMDFADVQLLFAPLYDVLDHHAMSELDGLPSQSTADLAGWIQARTAPLLPALCRIDLEETPGNGVILAWSPAEIFLL